ncbi:MAG TPA: hypothetical protein PKE57_08335 [Cellvibrionaceae bacterium]|jgi:hypothetical protein|nr:hypothetical protein [Cellvibrionaceae bacterium]HMW70628.1 hypothetical protein [Cellvibrionaceae bacterium]HNG61417.1 hypothetical protein [Cellvibrionaceae bacterium]
MSLISSKNRLGCELDVDENCDIVVSQLLPNSKEQILVLTIEAAEELIINLKAAIEFAKDGGYAPNVYPHPHD